MEYDNAVIIPSRRITNLSHYYPDFFGRLLKYATDYRYSFGTDFTFYERAFVPL